LCAVILAFSQIGTRQTAINRHETVADVRTTPCVADANCQCKFFVIRAIRDRCVVMAALWSRAGHYIFILWFLSIFYLLFSSPNLSGRRMDVYHTSTHDVVLVRI